MFYSKLRHTSSNSIIDISSTKYSKDVLSKHINSTNLFSSSLSKCSHNQNHSKIHTKPTSHFSHHDICQQSSLDKKYFKNAKEIFDKLFVETNFNDLLNQIEYKLPPIIDQLRENIKQKQILSKHERFLCMKSCAKFIIDTLINEKWDENENLTEFYHLQNILNEFLSKKQAKTLETELIRLNIHDLKNMNVEKSIKSKLNKNVSQEKMRKSSTRLSSSNPSTDCLTDRQKNYHKSISHVFRKLNSDLQKHNHEIPFQAHLSKYHRHNH